MISIEHKKELVKLFRSFGYKYDLHTLFSDFVELSAISISNSVDKQQFKKREEKYMQIINKYTKDEANIFPKMLAVLVGGLETKMTDLLGETFMELEISNSESGQFFTSYGVAKAMADMTITNVDNQINEKGYITVNEPAVGGGVTIIALAESLKEKGYNYQNQMKVVAQDIDIKSVHMSYLQLSLLGIDATVIRGNTLTLEMDSYWHTPMKCINLVKEKQEKKKVEKMKSIIHLLEDVPDSKGPLQLSLF